MVCGAVIPDDDLDLKIALLAKSAFKALRNVFFMVVGRNNNADLHTFPPHPLASEYAICRGSKSASADWRLVARRLASEVLYLPIHGALAVGDAKRVCAIIHYRLKHGF
jgi:hypothetical protein